jgi:hypothetical protein
MVPELLRSVRVTGPADPEAEMALPHTLQLLLPLYDGEGKLQREGGRLSITARGSSWVVRIDCPSEGYACDLAVPTLVAFLDAVERRLGSGDVSWQHDFAAQKKARQRLKERLK